MWENKPWHKYSFSVLSRTKNYLEGRYFSNDFPPCPRCTRQHSNKPSTCRSIDRMCRQCGLVGHFVEVHAVTDPKFRREIVAEIGFDIYSIQGCPPDPNVPNAASSSIGIVSTPSQVPASLGTFSDWYAVWINICAWLKRFNCPPTRQSRDNLLAIFNLNSKYS